MTAAAAIRGAVWRASETESPRLSLDPPPEVHIVTPGDNGVLAVRRAEIIPVEPDLGNASDREPSPTGLPSVRLPKRELRP
jgi:hypothetical protein